MVLFVLLLFIVATGTGKLEVLLLLQVALGLMAFLFSPLGIFLAAVIFRLSTV